MIDNINEPVIITPWTINHYIIGLLLFFIFDLFVREELLNFIIINIIHLCYELKDYYYTYYKSYNSSFIYYFSSKNTLINSIGDTILFLLGIYTAYYLKYNKNINKNLEECKKKYKLKLDNKYIFIIVFGIIYFIISCLFIYYNID